VVGADQLMSQFIEERAIAFWSSFRRRQARLRDLWKVGGETATDALRGGRDGPYPGAPRGAKALTKGRAGGKLPSGNLAARVRLIELTADAAGERVEERRRGLLRPKIGSTRFNKSIEAKTLTSVGFGQPGGV